MISKPLYNCAMCFETVFFDLDATLYPETNGLWPAIRMRIDQYMREVMQIPGDEIPYLREDYYINYGTSLVFALEFTDSGPKAQGLLTYSQSSDSRSPHYADQTRLFSQGQFRPMLFTEEEIAADLKSELTITAELSR